MSTKITYTCTDCGKAKRNLTLFGILHAFSMAKCQSCSGTMDLFLEFDFGLDAKKANCKVLDVFLPGEHELDSWEDKDGRTVTYYPFLVVLKGYAKARSVCYWLPYWHIVVGDRKIRKYGQWAPFMDDFLFESLLKQARDKGYFAEFSLTL